MSGNGFSHVSDGLVKTLIADLHENRQSYRDLRAACDALIDIQWKVKAALEEQTEVLRMIARHLEPKRKKTRG